MSEPTNEPAAQPAAPATPPVPPAAATPAPEPAVEKALGPGAREAVDGIMSKRFIPADVSKNAIGAPAASS